MLTRRQRGSHGAFLVLAAAVSAVGVFAGSTIASVKVGADCVQPLDLVSPNQDLSNCNLKEVTITGSTALYGSDLSGANMLGVTVAGGYKPLMRANLTGANLHGAIIGGAENELAPIQSANLTDANLSQATITGWNTLGWTNLSGANLNGATITVVEPLLPPLIGADYNNTTCPDGTNSDDHGDTCVGYGVPG